MAFADDPGISGELTILRARAAAAGVKPPIIKNAAMALAGGAEGNLLHGRFGGFVHVHVPMMKGLGLGDVLAVRRRERSLVAGREISPRCRQRSQQIWLCVLHQCRTHQQGSLSMELKNADNGHHRSYPFSGWALRAASTALAFRMASAHAERGVILPSIKNMRRPLTPKVSRKEMPLNFQSVRTDIFIILQTGTSAVRALWHHARYGTIPYLAFVQIILWKRAEAPSQAASRLKAASLVNLPST